MLSEGSSSGDLFRRRVGVGTVVVFCLIGAIRVPTSDYTARKDALAATETELSNHANNQIDMILSEVSVLKDDVLFLSHTPPIQGMVRAIRYGGYDELGKSNYRLWKERLEAIFTAYLKTHPKVVQLRYISALDDGTELVRVERKDGAITITPEGEYQKKGHREYFQEAVKRAANEVYISPIELNREFNKITQPQLPTIRIATPVFSDIDQQLFGLIVINHDMSESLSRLLNNRAKGLNTYLLDSYGNFLAHPEPGRAFGHEYGSPYRWLDEFEHRARMDQLLDPKSELLRFGGPDGQVDAVIRLFSYNKDSPFRRMQMVVTADTKRIDAIVIKARNRVVLALASVFLVTSLCLYFILQALKRREEASLKQAELGAIVSGSKDAIVGCTLDGVISSWNKAAEELFGYDEQSAIGQTVRSLLIPEFLNEEEDRILEQLARGETVSAFETVRRCKNRSLVDVSLTVSPIRASSGEIIGGATIARDITEYKLAEMHILDLNEDLERKVQERTLELEATNALQRVILNDAGYAIIATDPNGTITLFNPAAEKMLGYQAQELIGKKTPEVFHDEQEVINNAAALSKELGVPVEAGFDAFVAKARTGIADEGEWTYVRKDGSRLPVLLSVSALRNKHGEVTGYLAIASDRSLYKKQEKELVQAMKVADSANRAKSEFLANMSHEIRTPMNAVLGMMQLLERTKLDGRQADYLAKARTSARSLLSIINDILDFSKIEAGRLTLDVHQFQIDQVMRDVSMMLGATCGDKDLEILFRIDPQVPQHVLGDAMRLKQVLVNLAGNAVKFTEAGEVIITASVVERHNDEITLNFSISDTGIGISDSQKEHIFNAFSQAEAGTTRRYGGTGLGLVISQRLINLMGGELQMQSELHKGSTFSFTTRLQVDESSDQQLPTRSIAAHELQNLRVLIVDDNANARQIIGEMAASLGWTADQVDNGGDAIRRVAHSIDKQQPYHVIFVDWRMPGMDGWQTAEAIRNLKAAHPAHIIMMVTVYSRALLENRIESSPGLIEGFLIKPVSPSDMYNVVAEAQSGSPPSPKARRHRPVNEPRLTGLRVLLVEDNPTNQQVALELLNLEGALVDVTNGGEKAVNLILENPGKYDVVLMDIQMPDIDGYEATRRIRSKPGTQELPIIAMTANAMQSDREAALAAGMNEHIAKPFDIDDVVKTLLLQCDLATTAGRNPIPSSGMLPPDPPGFDFSTAVQRLGNNTNLFRQQSLRFCTQYASSIDQLEKQLFAYEDVAAADFLHGLRGAAATLGATALATSAGSLEKLVRSGAETEQRTRALRQLRDNLADATARLAYYADQLAACDEAVEPLDITDSDAVIALNEQLIELLMTSNMRATAVYAQLRPLLVGYPESSISVLDRAMEKLDFVTALGVARDILASNPAAKPALASGLAKN